MKESVGTGQNVPAQGEVGESTAYEMGVGGSPLLWGTAHYLKH